MRWLAAVLGFVLLAGASGLLAQSPPPVDRTRDRGEGVPLSMFGTYLNAGELIVYPFFEYYPDNNYEYEAGELGFVGTTELRGRFRAKEGLFLIAYGLSENVALEFEAAGISASLEKSPLEHGPRRRGRATTGRRSGGLYGAALSTTAFGRLPYRVLIARESLIPYH